MPLEAAGQLQLIFIRTSFSERLWLRHVGFFANIYQNMTLFIV
jgi:hypothetical protein